MPKLKLLLLLIACLTFTNSSSPSQFQQQPQPQTKHLIIHSQQQDLLASLQHKLLNTDTTGDTPHDKESNQDHIPNEEEQQQGHRHLTPADSQFWQFVVLSAFLTICGAFCSGMTVGLLSISTMQLQMMTLKKNPQQNKMASMILKVVSNHHLFLVTLLIANAIALESLPLVVHNLMPDWAAILFSTFIVLVVAEIVPQAYCTGPKKILLAYYASPVILVMIKIFWVLSYPIAKGLDYLLGVHSHERIQHKDFATFLNDDKYLKNTQKMLLSSTLELRTLRVTEVMIPTNDFFMSQQKQIITEQMVKEIQQKDYSYILIFKEKRNKITGVIKVKEFALKYLKESKRQMRAEEIMNHNVNLLTVYADTNLLQMLMLFQARSTRIALVCNLKGKIDPKMQSIMYSKSDMVLSASSNQVQVLGIVFLYQLFEQMTRLKSKIQRESNMPISSRNQQQPPEREMNTLNRPLIDK